jgi:hypothetical protein
VLPAVDSPEANLRVRLDDTRLQRRCQGFIHFTDPDQKIESLPRDFLAVSVMQR